MKYDYMLVTIYGIEESFSSLREAQQRGKELVKERPDCDPIIDQYYENDELTGEYWKYNKGKFIKAGPPISLKGWIA